MNAPRAVLFDWDNTLIESWGIIHHALRETFLALDLEPWSLEQTKAWVRRSMRDSFPELFGARAARAEALFYEHYRHAHIARLRPMAEAEATLARLADTDVVVGVVSSKLGTLVRKEATALGWERFFSRIVGAEDASADKPAPAAVALALEGSGVEASADVWYVGDTGIDVVCARNAGCVAVVIGSDPPRDGNRLVEADHQVDNLMGFQDCLRRHGMPI